MKKLPVEWKNVIQYIERPGNLEKMQAACMKILGAILGILFTLALIAGGVVAGRVIADGTSILQFILVFSIVIGIYLTWYLIFRVIYWFFEW